MSDILLTFLLPTVLIGFYIWLNWPVFKDSRRQQLVVGLGVLLYFTGLGLANLNPAVGSLLKLAGALIFLVLVLYQALKARK